MRNFHVLSSPFRSLAQHATTQYKLIMSAVQKIHPKKLLFLLRHDLRSGEEQEEQYLHMRISPSG